MILIQNGNGGNGSTPTPQPAELNIYSKDGSIDVIDEYDENDEPTGWKNIQRVNNLSAEELEAGAMVLMNFAEEDIVKKQQTYIISTNNGRRIEVTFSGAYTIKSLQDLNISVRGDVGDDDMCMIRMYIDPGDDQGNRYQGYFFMIWFSGPYQYTQDDDDAFYMSADSDRSLINWMWNGLSNEAIQRLVEFDGDVFYLSDYAEGGGEPIISEIKTRIPASWDMPNPDYAFIRPAIFQKNNISFIKEIHDRDFNYNFYFEFESDLDYNLDDSFRLNATVKDSGLRSLDINNDLLFYLNERCATNFASFLASFVPEEQKFPFVFRFTTYNGSLYFKETFRETAIQNGFIPMFIGVGTIYLEATFYYCRQMTEATIDIRGRDSVIKSLYRAFKGCDLLETVTIKNGDKTKYTTSLKETFSGCTNIETISFFDFNVDLRTNLDMSDCFLNCASLNQIFLDNCSYEFIGAIQDNVPTGVTVTVIN